MVGAVTKDPATFLGGLRVLEIGPELGEYAGKLLAGLGADVMKVEPPEGDITRGYGPFVDDVPHPDRSLHFWHFNLGKKSFTADLDSEQGQESLRGLAANADVLIDACPRDYLEERGLGYENLRARRPGLIYARISPFGDEGPWKDYRANDLVHLALGGVMMNCGYDSEGSGANTTRPIAPQMSQSYQIAGESLVIGILAALDRRTETGTGQAVSVSIHDAVSKNTEQDVPNWVFRGQEHHRQTARHSAPAPTPWALAPTKDNRYLLPYRTYLRSSSASWSTTVDLLENHGIVDSSFREALAAKGPESAPEINTQLSELVDDMVAKSVFEDQLWLEAQNGGLPWAPIRRPEENLDDPHWQSRETFVEVHHPELNRSFRYVGSRWLAPGIPWNVTRRPPLLGEHTAELLEQDRTEPALSPASVTPPVSLNPRPLTSPETSSNRAQPFALPGLRILDLSWLLASAGSGRFFSALGAEVVKVEHSSRWDRYRWGVGRVERENEADGTSDSEDPNRSGAFMEINAGKRSLSLNLKTVRGRELLQELIGWCDVVLEGFSPGTMDRLGYGYEQMKAINPAVIYVQQSGMGQFGTYGRLRSYGPTAQAISGLTDMSGLPEPTPPAGIGYSYLDWFGAYNMATAVAAALYRRSATGLGCHIDASQAETGIYLTGTAVLDFEVNGRSWTRYGNRSPHRPAAPHGVFPSAGEDRWIAIACTDEEQWHQLIEVLGHPDWAGRPEFKTPGGRASNYEALERLLSQETQHHDGYWLMHTLQARGVAAGVCQTAQDRIERDEQLRHLEWAVDLDQQDIGRWPIKELPFQLSETPPYIGGVVDRAGPSYAQDNEYVLHEILGLGMDEIQTLEKEGVIEATWRKA